MVKRFPLTVNTSIQFKWGNFLLVFFHGEIIMKSIWIRSVLSFRVSVTVRTWLEYRSWKVQNWPAHVTPYWCTTDETNSLAQQPHHNSDKSTYKQTAFVGNIFSSTRFHDFCNIHFLCIHRDFGNIWLLSQKNCVIWNIHLDVSFLAKQRLWNNELLCMMAGVSWPGLSCCCGTGLSWFPIAFFRFLVGG